ncbi:MAG: diguanylate cyclase (GGDEF)-like protein [Halieaceae bacterium]
MQHLLVSSKLPSYKSNNQPFRMNPSASERSYSASDIHDRLRAVAAWIGSLGFIANAAGYLALIAVGDASLAVTIENGSYALIFAMILLASRRNFHVRTVLYTGLVLIYCVFWITAFTYARIGHEMVLAIPLVVFVPLLLAMILDYRILLALAPIQFACSFFYSHSHALRSINASITADELMVFSVSVGAFSSFTFCALAVIARERDITDRKLVQFIAEKERLAAIDDLTGLMSRGAFMDRLNAYWEKHLWMALAFIDLDHFKPLNDQYGHSVGDDVLNQVARRLESTSPAATAARLGGDEFAVAFPHQLPPAALAALVGELHSAITADYQSEAGPISIGASIGFAENTADVDSLSKLLRAADAAMRRAKATRVGWTRYDNETDSAALAYSSLEMGLKEALRCRQIAGAVQPIASTGTHEIVEYELLARWPNSGFSIDPSPAEFIHIAEKLGLLNEILWMTLNEALATLDLKEASLAVNVSPAQLLASDFLEKLTAILEHHQTDPARITLEITEEVAYRNLEKNVIVLERARNLGMAIALDDFGSGYSSLSMLDALPLDKLKIDQSLVVKAQNNERGANILRAAINLAGQLKLVCCVEGVETAIAAREVAQMGADQVQGYWIGRPVLLSDTKAKLQLVS